MGHSGDSDEIPFVNSASPPSNDKERLQVLKVVAIQLIIIKTYAGGLYSALAMLVTVTCL